MKNLKAEARDNPIVIERDFKNIKSKINSNILKRTSQIPQDSLFRQLDIEFEKVRKIYEKQGDKINLLHVEHNYLWSKSFQYLRKDLNQSIILIVEAISKLLNRCKLKPYPDNAFYRMLKAYEVAFIKINEQIDNFNITYPSIIKSKDVGNSINVIEQIPAKMSYLPSLGYEVLYRFRKRQLHFLSKFMFFERSEDKKRKAQEIINKITEEMIKYSEKSLKYAREFNSKLASQEQSIKEIMALKELDILTARYFKEAYSKKELLKAWNIMDKIKQFLVIKAFRENVQLSNNLLKYYSEEWSLLYIFAKICLLRKEVIKRSSSLCQSWEKDVFEKVTRSLDTIETLFKYEMEDAKDYSLKIMTSSFAGVFSEYFIHELCRDFFDYGVIDVQTSSQFKDLLNSIKLAGNKDDIKLKDTLIQEKPDIDIHIKNICAIFLKNAKVDSKEVHKIWEEIKLCHEKGINKIFYGVNFIKNIEKIEYVRESFEKIKTSYTVLTIEVFDIKDLVSVLLDELKRSGRSKLKFSQLDLYKVLDY